MRREQSIEEIRQALEPRIADCRQRNYSFMSMPVAQVEILLAAAMPNGTGEEGSTDA